MSVVRLTLPKTKLESNLEYVEEPLTIIENCVRTAITNLNISYSRFWSMTDEDIQEVFDQFKLDGVMNILTGHYTTAVALNAIKSLRNIDGPDAIATKPRDFEVREDGSVVLVPIGGWPVAEESPIDNPSKEVIIEDEPVVQQEP